MKSKLMELLLGAQIRMRNFWEDFKTEEKGAAEIVAIILIIVIIIAVAVIFRTQIEGIVNDVFSSADTFVSDTLPTENP